MKTEALFLMTAATLGTATAQVPVIESVTLTVPPGFCLLANHLDHAGGNTLNAVLPNVPEGSQVLKLANNNYTRDDFSIDDGGWIDAETLEPSVRTASPGEGFFFYNPSSQNLQMTFTGAVRQGVLSVPLAGNRFSLIGSPVPRPVSLTNHFPTIPDMQIMRYDCAEQRYKAFSFAECGPGWICLLDSDTLEPVNSTFAIPVGEGFFVYNPGSAISWTFVFNVE
jgi:hypothetical protein